MRKWSGPCRLNGAFLSQQAERTSNATLVRLCRTELGSTYGPQGERLVRQTVVSTLYYEPLNYSPFAPYPKFRLFLFRMLMFHVAALINAYAIAYRWEMQSTSLRRVLWGSHEEIDVMNHSGLLRHRGLFMLAKLSNLDSMLNVTSRRSVWPASVT